MSDENEVVPQDVPGVENFSLFPPRRVYVMNTPLPVEEVDKSARKVIVENTPLLVEEVNTNARKVVIENAPLSVKVESGSVSLTGTPTIQATMARQKWEYTYFQNNGGDPVGFVNQMNAMGKDGWEVMLIERGAFVFLKRPV